MPSSCHAERRCSSETPQPQPELVKALGRRDLAEAEEAARDLERILSSFAFLADSAERSFEVRLLALAARCGSELDWAPTWDAAAQRARDAKKPVLVLVWAYPGFEITDSARMSTFMDEDVVALVRERFASLGVQPVGSTPDQFAATIREDLARWSKVIKAAGINAE